jgi:DNA-binding response OmpR family regulator
MKKEPVHAISERLRTRKLESMVAYKGEEPAREIETGQPEVIVLDLQTPRTDGLEALRRVETGHLANEIIILTDHGSRAEAQLAIQLGALFNWRKPVDLKVLIWTMQTIHRETAEAEVVDG